MKHGFDAHIQEIEQAIGYTFRDKGLLMQAFTRTSFCNEQSDRSNDRYRSNEVLEFFGDSVLSAAVVSLLIRSASERYIHGIRTELAEGDLSGIKSRLSDKTNLSRSMRALGLQEYLLMGEGDAKLGIENEPSVMEDLFESILGAIYIDADMDLRPVMTAVDRMLDVSVYRHPTEHAPIKSYKNALQEYCADKRRRLPPPAYRTVSEEGPEHQRTYTRACYIGERCMGIGQGKNQKAADTAAAEAALAALQSKEQEHTAPPEDAIRQLCALAKAHRTTPPTFIDEGAVTDAAQSTPLFAATCRYGDEQATATAPSKRAAKQAAARAMLAHLKKQK